MNTIYTWNRIFQKHHFVSTSVIESKKRPHGSQCNRHSHRLEPPCNPDLPSHWRRSLPALSPRPLPPPSCAQAGVCRNTPLLPHHSQVDKGREDTVWSPRVSALLFLRQPAMIEAIKKEKPQWYKIPSRKTKPPPLHSPSG